MQIGERILIPASYGKTRKLRINYSPLMQHVPNRAIIDYKDLNAREWANSVSVVIVMREGGL